MRQCNLYGVVLGLGLLSAPPAAAASGPCNPPTRICDGGDGIAYECPPCRPNLAAKSNAPAALRLETYREALEDYRRSLEDRRARDAGGSLEGYRQGMTSYREGIEGYQESQAAARSAEAGEP